MSFNLAIIIMVICGAYCVIRLSISLARDLKSMFRYYMRKFCLWYIHMDSNRVDAERRYRQYQEREGRGAR